jgi:hypothetical protein
MSKAPRSKEKFREIHDRMAESLAVSAARRSVGAGVRAKGCTVTDSTDSEILPTVTLDLQQVAEVAEVIAKCHINLSGKDYFTMREAAAYACISLSQWRARVQPWFPAGKFCGRLIYRRSDVQRYFEQSTRWPEVPKVRTFDAHRPIARSAEEIRDSGRWRPGRRSASKPSGAA